MNKNGLKAHKTGHVKASTHEYVLYKRRHPRLPDAVCLGLDLGYAGIKTDYPTLKCELPFKRKNPGGANGV